jgi:hypothetical protein
VELWPGKVKFAVLCVTETIGATAATTRNSEGFGVPRLQAPPRLRKGIGEPEVHFSALMLMPVWQIHLSGRLAGPDQPAAKRLPDTFTRCSPSRLAYYLMTLFCILCLCRRPRRLKDHDSEKDVAETATPRGDGEGAADGVGSKRCLWAGAIRSRGR